MVETLLNTEAIYLSVVLCHQVINRDRYSQKKIFAPSKPVVFLVIWQAFETVQSGSMVNIQNKLF